MTSHRLTLIANTPTYPPPVCSDNCEQHALYGRMFNAHPLETSSREQLTNGRSQPVHNYPSFLETLEEQSSEDDSSETEVLSEEEDKAAVSCDNLDKSPHPDIPIISITMPKSDAVDLEDVD